MSIAAAFCQPAFGRTKSVQREMDAPTKNPASLVNVFIGTGNGGKVTGNVNTFPGADVPFGMISWSPSTPSRHAGSDYAYSDSSVIGFSLTHLSGPGCYAGGEVPILPTVAPIGKHPQALREAFSHTDEHAKPGQYHVVLSPSTPQAIKANLTTTIRTGLGSFHFPAKKQPKFIFKVSDSQSETTAASVRIIGSRRLAGMVTAGHFCGTASSATLYFVAEFNRPFRGYGTWEGHTTHAASRGAAGERTGAWVRFAAAPHAQTVKLKVAISYVSVADAWQNLRAEDPGWSYSTIASQASAAWNRILSRIRVKGGTRDQRVQFYSALYHALLYPNVFSDVNGAYKGFDNKIHFLGPHQKAQYANFSGWDIYRSEIPLLTLLAPQRVSNMIQSLLNDERQGGWLPKWGYDNDYTGVMNGDAADPIIAEAYAFGARGFNVKDALSAMIHGATRTSEPATWSGVYVERPHLRAYEKRGYVPGNASETLEYAVADFSISRLAKTTGDTKAYRKFLTRSQDWANTFDSGAKYRGFSGYSEPRSMGGVFPSGPGFQIKAKNYGQAGFEEGNTIQYTWMVPQDLHGLIQAIGGNATAVRRLDIDFKHLNVGPNKPYYWAGNEPGLTMPWIYDYTGTPYKAQALVHRLLRRVYADRPGGEPGNDDLGAMRSWLVWADMGLFPETPGTPVLVIGAPVFPHITLTIGAGKGHQVVISAPGANLHSYIHKLYINDRLWRKDWLTVSQLLENKGRQSRRGHDRSSLSFVLSSRADHRWGAAPADAPPSYPVGPVHLPKENHP